MKVGKHYYPYIAPGGDEVQIDFNGTCGCSEYQALKDITKIIYQIIDGARCRLHNVQSCPVP